MKTLSLPLAALLVATTLAACGPKTEASVPAARGDMDMAPADKMAKGVGVVTAIDKTAGVITLDHEAIPEAGWPAMTMGFKIAPALLDGVAAGDKVAFDLKIHDGSGEVTAIHKE